MAKTIKSIGFTKKDEELVEKITAYQEKNNLSFIAAVRGCVKRRKKWKRS